jgi:hypothetical protein
MSPNQKAQQLAHAKKRRTANNNYHKLLVTLYKKLSKLTREYHTDIYFIAHRNGRFNGFTSEDPSGQAWSPPTQSALVSNLVHLLCDLINYPVMISINYLKPI